MDDECELAASISRKDLPNTSLPTIEQILGKRLFISNELKSLIHPSVRCMSAIGLMNTIFFFFLSIGRISS